MNPERSGLSLALARHAAAASLSALPPEVGAATCTSILDQGGVILAASGLAACCEPFVRMAREGAVGDAEVLGHGFKTSAEMAAFANGSMAHALDFEDTHDATLVHPHAAVLPAALAVAQTTGASGADLLVAVAVGADIACRIALAFEESPERPDGFTVIPLIGVYGATAAACRLFGLSAERTVHAFSIALGLVTGSSAAQHHASAHWRAVRDGFSARAAVTAALLARHGLAGFERPLEGPAGYYALYAGGRYNEAAVLDQIGVRYEGAGVSFKPWPSCRGTHAFVEAALLLAGTRGLRADEVREIKVRVSPFFATLCEPAELRCRPPTATAAKFSIPFTIGLALARGRVALDDFQAEALNDPAVLAIASRVSFEVCAAWTGAQSTRGAVSLTMVSGEQHEHEVRDPLGYPTHPMAAEDLRRKFLDCASQAARPIRADRAERIAARIGALASLGSVTGLFD